MMNRRLCISYHTIMEDKDTRPVSPTSACKPGSFPAASPELPYYGILYLIGGASLRISAHVLVDAVPWLFL